MQIASNNAARAGLGPNMITLEDCIGLCGLTEEEVLAIAEHEHLPEVAATALAQYLLSHEHGSEKVRDMIRFRSFSRPASTRSRLASSPV